MRWLIPFSLAAILATAASPALAEQVSPPKADTPASKAAPASAPAVKPAAVSTITTDRLAGFADQPATVRAVIEKALMLTRMNLTYTFASSDPANGGMDCSGTIYHLLHAAGFKDAPRQSDELCIWIKDQGNLHLTPQADRPDHPEFAALKPGDLLFWIGTYDTKDRALPVSHVMLYLGKLKADGRPVMFGSSDGRRYAGQSRCGVSVFDFEFPKPGGKTAFYGFGSFISPAPAEIRKAESPAR